jgi:nucleoside-diphosphate-sugar epimerase
MIDALITGAGGFIGQALCTHLRSEGKSVLALTSADGDVSSADTWKALEPARVVYHLAGRSYVPDSWTRSADFLAANVVGTERALAYCREHGARLVFASAYVYGIPERLPIGEGDKVAPNNPYALSKRLAEQLCEFAAQYHGVTSTALRIFNVFGPGQRAEFLIPKILEQVAEAREIRLFDLAPRRDYVFLDDVVNAFAKAADVNPGFHSFNVGSGVSLSVSEIVEKIQAVAGTRLPVVSDSLERRQEIPDVVADITSAQLGMGWRPQWSFERGIEQILKRG